MPKLRVGVIGCGLVAQVMHLPHLRELADQYSVDAICDLSPRILQRIGDAYCVDRRFLDWRELIREPLDAVLVLTSGSHAPIALAAAERGLHLFVEKPLCLSVTEGREVIDAARAAKVRLMVGYMKRYDPAFERLRDECAGMSDLRLVRVTTLEAPF